MKIDGIARLVVGGSLLTLMLAAHADSTWNFGSGCAANSTTAFTSCTLTTLGESATVTGWSTTGSGSTFAAQSMYQFTGGLGVNTGGTEAPPEHAVDNVGSSELVSFKFGPTKVQLTQLNLGYTQEQRTTGGTTYNNFADVSVLAYTGTGTPPSSISGLTRSGLLANGWTLVSHYLNKSSANGAFAVNAGGISSSWWLVGAFDNAYGTVSGQTGYDNKADFVKVLAVSALVPTTTQSVPEPGILGLFGVALVGMIGAKRSRRKA